MGIDDMKYISVFMVALALCLTAKAGELFFPNPASTKIVYQYTIFSTNYAPEVFNTNYLVISGASNATLNVAYAWNSRTNAYTNTTIGAIGYKSSLLTNFWFAASNAIVFTNASGATLGDAWATNGYLPFEGGLYVDYSNIPLSTLAYTNSISVIASKQQTIQWFYTSAGTSATTIYIDRTTDTNWLQYTNTAYTTSSNGEFAVVGKWSQYRFRVSTLATNCSLNAALLAE